ncbi:hypothetical protein MXL46_06550 [Heyndrickxia sporothermodurans]|uniref:Spore coat protein n=1 Tax=Heyndrickxia sporothermodurans TaxID=46224 RepID=A0A150L928_9BACI|nr:hypothetical protein [Heyndrickxia sporothermodurans]KYD08853.1 hypothetical protein B4102_1860 [Heyndrickxia sporothermodurans]MBL5767187.1 hypothetical protein [Heyndrickxia sporothermodurans]MBL5770686.1 hypothetical protein [Heyndrickxia sporothermodurans]MBL5774338.1 hypothetical protein [Heyndrickxia sporothermodurans]MBL5778452.1 hypothetical protein [Heyndrickxia sporothermodurans]
MQQQPYNQQNQQVSMPQPPDILSTKDLSYIDDMLSWNLLAMKKAHFAAMHCQDASVKNALEKCGQMHQNHYNKILNHLQAHLQTQPGSQQNQQFM